MIAKLSEFTKKRKRASHEDLLFPRFPFQMKHAERALTNQKNNPVMKGKYLPPLILKEQMDFSIATSITWTLERSSVATIILSSGLHFAECT